MGTISTQKTLESLVAYIENAYMQQEAILFYYWVPTALTHELDTRDLEQPDSSACPDEDPTHGCSFPASEIMIAMNTELVQDAPELGLEGREPTVS